MNILIKIKMNSNKKCCLFPKPQLKHLLFLFYFISSIVKQYIFKDMKEDYNLSIPIFKLYIYIYYLRFTFINAVSNNKVQNKV